MPDFVGFIRASEMLLKPGGVLAMAVPDKRYIFDALRAPSSTGQVLEAYMQGRTRHSSAAMFDFVAGYAQFGTRDVWSVFDEGVINNIGDVAGAYNLIKQNSSENSPYHDVHGWVFTPSSLRLLMHDLAALGLTNFKEALLREAHLLEFYVAFTTDAPGNGLDRATLCRAQIWEDVVQGLKLLAENNPLVTSARDMICG
jgi:hypothetical protein